MTIACGIRPWAIAVGSLVILGAAVPLLPAQTAGKAEAAAFQALNANRLDEAQTDFQAILATNPADVRALEGMGRIRMQQGNYLGAVSFLERAKQASQNDAGISAELDQARFSFLMGEGKDSLIAHDLASAEQRYREALDLQPGAADACSALVNVLVLENKLSDAQDLLSTAVAHEAETLGAPSEGTEIQLAELDLAAGQPALAYPIFRQVLEDHPERVDAWSGLLSALHLMGHDQDAAAQANVIPAETLNELKANPSFVQMMTEVSAAPPATGAAASTTPEAAFQPLVPSAEPPAIAAPATATVGGGTSPSPTGPAPGSAAVPAATVPHTLANTRTVAPAALPATPAAPRPAIAAPHPVPTPETEAVRRTQGVPPASAPAASTATHADHGPLVTQPAAPPPASNSSREIPDTGDQQYPQPRRKPRTASSQGSSTPQP
ncbi:MAG TPA: tetratricopeptide repeat protein [Acidobacteriaceae bacterium]|nr:tetratricopeptide repeat protein [Acidobacteriaceae bacterium]